MIKENSKKKMTPVLFKIQALRRTIPKKGSRRKLQFIVSILRTQGQRPACQRATWRQTSLPGGAAGELDARVILTDFKSIRCVNMLGWSRMKVLQELRIFYICKKKKILNTVGLHMS